MEVVILCGGKGSRLSEETINKPKPMVEIGGMPILWHIMNLYSFYGYKKFILALGYKANYIKEYFYNLKNISGDFKISLSNDSSPIFFNKIPQHEWEITFVDTGEETLKGARIKKVEKYIESENFLVTYGDGIGDIDISKLISFHKSHNKVATLTAVRPPSRFGELEINGTDIINFEEKPQMHTGYINGGFFVFKKEIFNSLNDSDLCDLEFGTLQEISKKNELKAYIHDKFWQCMDNVRERDFLDQLVKQNKAPWIK